MRKMLLCRLQCVARGVLALTLLVAIAGSVQAQDAAHRQLIVGTKQAPPFAIKNADGTWWGISPDLWRTIATQIPPIL